MILDVLSLNVPSLLEWDHMTLLSKVILQG